MVRRSTYYMPIINCGYCNKEFKCSNRDINRAKEGSGLNYCSRECFCTSRRNPVLVECQECQKQLIRTLSTTSERNFCSKSCSAKYYNRFRVGEKHPNFIAQATIKNYRARGLQYYGAVCRNCGYDKYEAMLDVHHIDGNRGNNSMENLQVLCIWCHGLLTRNVPEHNRD